MGKVYHTNIKIRFVLGLMNKNEIGGIPFSTRDYWKRYFNLGKVIGIQDQDMDVEKATFHRLLNSIFHQMRRDGAAYFSQNTFYISDNFSKCLLGWQVSTVKNSAMSVRTIDALNKKFKREYLKEPEKQGFSQIVKTIEFFESDYNSRPHGVLKGLTPLA